VGAYLKVVYHKSFEEALPLGTIPEIVGNVASSLGVANAKEFTANLNTMLTDLEGFPLVKPAVTILKEGVVKVTDLGIDTQTGKYQFGFGADLAGKNIRCGPVSVDAFGLLFTYTQG
jgi:hypothetical protein